MVVVAMAATKATATTMAIRMAMEAAMASITVEAITAVAMAHMVHTRYQKTVTKISFKFHLCNVEKITK